MSSKPGSNRWPEMKLGGSLSTVGAVTGMKAARAQRRLCVRDRNRRSDVMPTLAQRDTA